jgi:hypothetical protein
VVTDLNIFRKVGSDWGCVPRREVWITPTPGQVVTTAYTYQNIGSFRGTDQVRRDGSRVTVLDRAGWERSQIVAQRVYKPENGSYFRQDDPTKLLEPVAVGLAFGTGQPDNTRQVYYPEKTVLAFFVNLGPDTERAMTNVCGDAKGRPKYYPEDFGLTVPARQLEQVVVCELAYVPNVQAEQNHETQTVTVQGGRGHQRRISHLSRSHRAPLHRRGSPNPDALPYGCEWCLQECVAVRSGVLALAPLIKQPTQSAEPQVTAIAATTRGQHRFPRCPVLRYNIRRVFEEPNHATEPRIPRHSAIAAQTGAPSGSGLQSALVLEPRRT